MIKNIPYFGERGDTTSAAGWKNSVRHNLSLHSRFVRVQNEEAGKSSWWTCNTSAGTGSPNPPSSGTHNLFQQASTSGALSPEPGQQQRRGQRRRATVETSSHQMITARNRVLAKVGAIGVRRILDVQ